MTSAHVFLYQDVNDRLSNPAGVSVNELRSVLVNAANAIIAAHGDNFDYIGFWTDFDDAGNHVQRNFIIRNDVQGIGLPIADDHAAYGLAGTRVRSLVYMDNVTANAADPGDFSRRIAGHEFSHTWVCHLPPITVNGEMLTLQASSSGPCGGGFSHWNGLIDTNGGCNDGQEWVGANPAVRSTSFPREFTFNTDTGGLWSFPSLYLMGYVTAAEADSMQSELRYMADSTDCAQTYPGRIVPFTVADIVAAAGPRVPDATTSQKDYRVAWCLISRQGRSPSSRNVNRVIANGETLRDDWSTSTLGRGTLNPQLFVDLDCNGAPDAQSIAAASDRALAPSCAADYNGDGVVDTADLAAFVSDWLAGRTPAASAGSVAAFVRQWLAGCDA